MQKTAFFDIDTQFDFMKENGKLCVGGAEKIISNLRKLTTFAKNNKIIVISSVDAHSSKDPEFSMFPAHCVKGKAGQRKIKETLIINRISINLKKHSRTNLNKLLNKYRQIILEKKTFDVFSNPNTKTLLHDIDTVFVYGVATDYCVKAACLGLLNLKKKVNLVTDAIRAVSVKEGQKTTRLLKAKGVRLVITKSVIKSPL